MSKNTRVIVAAHISDIHFGAFDSDDLIDELKYYFLRQLKKMPKLDVIFIQGDLYHYELSLNSRAALNSFKFINKLQEIAYEKNAKIRIIKGTKSHDYNQLANIKFNKRIDLKIIDTVKVEEIFEGYKVLYLPEEYVNDQEEYYGEYLNPINKYDVIIGHGMVEEVSFKKFSSEVQLKSAPIFKSKDLINACKGFISFGHIHTSYIIKDKIYYTGSFSRWCHGEEEPKGFYFSLYSTKNNNYKIIPVENKMAYKFITKHITKIIMNRKVEDVIDIIESYQIKKNIKKLRLKIKEVNNKDFMLKLELLKKYFRNNKNIDLDITSLIIDDEDENIEEFLDRYDYLFDKKMTTEETISTFINNEFDYELSVERIDELLHDDIIKKINEKLFRLGNEV